MIKPARLAVAALALLAGCAAPPPPAPSTEVDAKSAWRRHQTEMSAISEWHLKGRIAVRAERKGGNATILWEQRRERQIIQLYGPFGSGRIRIVAQPGHAVLSDARGRTTEAASAAEALYQRLGWRIPFAELHHWVRGLPDERATGIVIDGAGRLKRFRQGDWRVEYQNYKAVGRLDLPQQLSITALPGKLEIYADDGAYIGDQLSLRMVVNRWRDIDFAR